MAKIYLVGILLIITFLNCLYAEDVIIDVYPSNAFFGDTINISIKCPDSENYFLDKLILNRNDGTQRIFQYLSTNQLILTQKDYVLPDFSILAVCSNETHSLQNSSFIRLNVLDFIIERILNNYTNEETTIQLSLSLRVNNTNINLNFSDFDLSFSYTNDFVLERNRNNFFIRFTSNKPIDSIQRITLYLRNFNRSFTQELRLIISNPLRAIVFFDENRIYYPEENITIPIEIFYKDIRLFSDNVSIILDNVKVNRIFDCSDRVCINLFLPRESSQIKFRITYGIHSIEIRRLVTIGKIGLASFYDYDNKPISVNIRIDNLQYSVFGNQTFLFIPGIRNITIKHKNLEVNLINTNLTEFEESIRLYPIEINERNLKVLDFFIFETNLNAEKIIARIYYDERKIDSENRILVAFCEEFSLKEKMCKKWNLKNFYQNFISNFVEFEILPKEFFGIIEKLELKLQYNLNKQKFYLNDKVIFKGIVVDSFGRLQDVRLIVTFLNRNYSFQTQNGKVEFVLDAPSVEGRYFLVIFSDSNLFVNFRENISIIVEPKIELSLLTQSVKISDINSEFFVEIKNVGQKDLENIDIIAENCKTFTEKIERISVNEIVKINLFGCSNSSNPQIVRIILKSKENEFKFDIPVYFESNVIRSDLTVPTGKFVLALDTNTYISILVSFFIILSSILISRRRKAKDQKIRGKDFLKRKFS